MLRGSGEAASPAATRQFMRGVGTLLCILRVSMFMMIVRVDSRREDSRCGAAEKENNDA